MHRAIVVTRDEEPMGRVSQMLDRVASKKMAPWPKMLRGMEVRLRFFMKHPAHLKMLLLEGYIWYHSVSHPVKEAESHWAEGSKLLEAGFVCCVHAGQFVYGNPAEQSRTLVALQQTRLANWALGGMKQPHDEVVSWIRAEFVRTFCKPAVAVKLLSDDGAKLRSSVLDNA